MESLGPYAGPKQGCAQAATLSVGKTTNIQDAIPPQTFNTQCPYAPIFGTPCFEFAVTFPQQARVVFAGKGVWFVVVAPKGNFHGRQQKVPPVIYRAC